MTSATGDYSFTHLTPGVHQLDVSAPGFVHLTRTGVTALVGQTVAVDLVLTLGGSRQTIQVSADAPLLQSETSNIQTNIPGNTVVAMPLNTRNFVQLATLAPGVALPPGTLLPRINGGRPRTNEYLYDGISALQPEPGQVAFFPILDGIQEFTVETNNVPAEFGRFNGGVVNVATRSGSNTLHGSLFEFFRNEDLNTPQLLRITTGAQTRIPAQSLRRLTLGAPILHDRLFFFGDYQGVKAAHRRARASPPSPRSPSGRASSPVFRISTTRQPPPSVNGSTSGRNFPNDVINMPLDPAAQSLLARFPTPTKLNAAANNYTRTANDSRPSEPV